MQKYRSFEVSPLVVALILLVLQISNFRYSEGTLCVLITIDHFLIPLYSSHHFGRALNFTCVLKFKFLGGLLEVYIPNYHNCTPLFFWLRSKQYASPKFQICRFTGSIPYRFRLQLTTIFWGYFLELYKTLMYIIFFV